MISTGYSPTLCFDVENVDELIPRLLMQGARLDGPIKRPVQGKVTSLFLSILLFFALT